MIWVILLLVLAYIVLVLEHILHLKYALLALLFLIQDSGLSGLLDQLDSGSITLNDLIHSLFSTLRVQLSILICIFVFKRIW